MKVGPADFSPPLLRIRERPPAPLAGWLLRMILALLACVALWAAFGPLDIVAVAEGKLVPSGYLKIVQTPEQGIVREILVREGEAVKEGDVLIRMDPVIALADTRSVQADLHNKRLALRRIDAQLSGAALLREQEDPPELFAQVQAQYISNLRAYENALAQERTLLDKARHDLEAAVATKRKLEQVLPHYVEQEAAFEKLVRDGYAGRILYTDKRRERIEREQDLHAQEAIMGANRALIAQSEKKLAQITADYRRQLRAERVDAAAQFEKLRQELAKQEHRQQLLELRAPQAGIVKDLATHTVGTVTMPGTILMTLVPNDGELIVEVWISNVDVGFVRPGQAAKVKLAPFQFTKYGMVEGSVRQVSVDATEAPSANTRSDALGGRDRPMGPLAYRTLIALEAQALEAGGVRYPLSAGMQAAAEIHLGKRTVLEYVLSPVRQAFHEAGRER